MNNTLIVYASDHGSVEKCSRELFTLIKGKVDLCDLYSREIAPDLSVYDTVIIGGSIHSGEIQNVISAFCAENIDVLVKKHIGLFINCIYSDEIAQKQLNDAYPFALRDIAVVSDYFGGEVNELKLNYLERIITKQMIEQENLVVKLSKERIEQFAKKISSVNEEKI